MADGWFVTFQHGIDCIDQVMLGYLLAILPQVEEPVIDSTLVIQMIIVIQ